MNYKFYSLKLNIRKVGRKLDGIIFYLPRALYEKNASFRNFITKIENNSYIRRKKIKLANDIFYYLDENGKCEIPSKYAYVGDFYFDVVSHDIDLLLEDKKWVKKNKLQIVETTFFEYIKENYPDYLFSLSDSQKEQKIYIVTRKKDLK